jgi:hypothetical protein
LALLSVVDAGGWLSLLPGFRETHALLLSVLRLRLLVLTLSF